MRTYENRLPEGYYAIKTISPSKDRKDSMIGMLCVFMPALLLLVLGFLLVKVTAAQCLTLLLLIPCIPVYLILHELLHGLVYLILTGRRFQIGRNQDGFCCILPELYVSFQTQLLCAAAPVLVFTAALLGGSIIAMKHQSGLFMLLSCLLAFHFFACRGDIYLMKELLTIKDTGNLLIREEKNGDNVVFCPKRSAGRGQGEERSCG